MNHTFVHSLTICAWQGQGPYASRLKTAETDIKDIQKRINEKLGKEVAAQFGSILNVRQG